MRERIPIVSIFTGAGGMDLGFERAGFDTILALENDDSAIETYNWNRTKQVACKADLAALTDDELLNWLEEVAPGINPRGLIGGPPCQSFSVGNVNGKANDPRAALPFAYARLLAALNRRFRLDFFAFENVGGLAMRKHSSIYRRLWRALEDAGFAVYQAELNAAAFGVAQSRRRIFLVGINSRHRPNTPFSFPQGSTVALTTRQTIAHLPAPAFFRRDIKREDIPHHVNHWTMNPRSSKFTNGGESTGRSFRKLEWDKPSWTVAYGNREVHLHPDGKRRVSVFEAMLLQGFPETYELRGNLSAQIRQVSDAVPPPLAAAVADAVRELVYSRPRRIARKLISWFRNHSRSFPWRETTDPYRVIIAEKLLQQTAAKEVTVRAYRELITRFPDFESLAEARLANLKALILPLGFSYRADELRSLARAVIHRHNGAVPSNLKQLLALPGVGDYIARAVLSFVFLADVPVVDTNVARFLYRLYGLEKKLPTNPARDRQLIEMATVLVPVGQSRNFNLAILDLCASICTPGIPACERCILRKECVVGRARTGAGIPTGSGQRELFTIQQASRGPR